MISEKMKTKKVNYREIFKPTLGKILLTILLVLILPNLYNPLQNVTIQQAFVGFLYP